MMDIEPLRQPIINEGMPQPPTAVLFDDDYEPTDEELFPGEKPPPEAELAETAAKFREYQL